MAGGWRFKKGLQASTKIRPTQQNRVLRQNCFVHIRPQGTGTARQIRPACSACSKQQVTSDGMAGSLATRALACAGQSAATQPRLAAVN